MFDFFQQPWTLLGASVLVLFGVLTYRSVWYERRRPWQWLLPVAVALLALGLDGLVATDLERIHTTLKGLVSAVQNEDCPAVAGFVTDDYSDSRHSTKARLMAHCQQELDGPTIVRLKKLAHEIDLSPREAVANLSFFIRFEEGSRIARQYKEVFLVVVEFHLRKEADGQWLINSAEIKEVDKMPVTWSRV
jgi:hypothetical protein